MFGILVIGSIRSTEPMETSGIQRAHATWAHFWPDFVDFMAPPEKIKKEVVEVLLNLKCIRMQRNRKEDQLTHEQVKS